MYPAGARGAKSPRPRVLVVAEQPAYPFWGGSEKFWYEALLRHDVRERIAATVLLRSSDATNVRATELRRAGVDVVPYPTFALPSVRERVTRRLPGLRYDDRERWWRDAITRIAPSCIWFNLAGAHSVLDIAAGADVAFERKIPYVLVFQHVHDNFLLDPEWQSVLETVCVRARRAVFVARRNQRAVEVALGGRLVNAYLSRNTLSDGAVEAAGGALAARETSATELRFANVARVDAAFKGQHILLEALSDDVWRERPWHLTFHGTGTHERLLLRWAAMYAIEPSRLSIRGPSDSVWHTFAASDVVALPSLSEGTPFALLEGMASGAPAVVTAVGGMDDVVTDDVNGWVAPSPRSDAIAAALERCWRDRERIREMGLAGREVVVNGYLQEPTVSEFIGLLES